MGTHFAADTIFGNFFAASDIKDLTAEEEMMLVLDTFSVNILSLVNNSILFVEMYGMSCGYICMYTFFPGNKSTMNS